MVSLKGLNEKKKEWIILASAIGIKFLDVSLFVAIRKISFDLRSNESMNDDLS